MVKIVGIGGSFRAGSYSQLALRVAAERAQALGAEVEIFDLRSICRFATERMIIISTRMWKSCGMQLSNPTA